MLLETKVMQVQNDTDTINEINNVMSCFGWFSQSTQITHSQNTKTYSSAWDRVGGNQTQTVETTTINYATLTFQRDKSMRNYAEIVRIENEYNQVHARRTDIEAEIAREFDRDSGCFMLILKLAFWPVTLVLWLLKGDKKDEKRRNDNAAIDELKQKEAALLRKAEALLV